MRRSQDLVYRASRMHNSNRIAASSCGPRVVYVVRTGHVGVTKSQQAVARSAICGRSGGAGPGMARPTRCIGVGGALLLSYRAAPPKFLSSNRCFFFQPPHPTPQTGSHPLQLPASNDEQQRRTFQISRRPTSNHNPTAPDPQLKSKEHPEAPPKWSTSRTQTPSP